MGASFTDVPTSNPFYRFVETILHKNVTGGCTATTYCPSNPTTREQMAVFVLVSKEPAGLHPARLRRRRTCSPTSRRPAPSAAGSKSWPTAAWSPAAAPNLYCPTGPATREQMAVFVLRTLDPALNPPACVPPNLFADVPETSPFCRWIEELANRGVVTGCGGGNYCPDRRGHPRADERVPDRDLRPRVVRESVGAGSATEAAAGYSAGGTSRADARASLHVRLVSTTRLGLRGIPRDQAFLDLAHRDPQELVRPRLHARARAVLQLLRPLVRDDDVAELVVLRGLGRTERVAERCCPSSAAHAGGGSEQARPAAGRDARARRGRARVRSDQVCHSVPGRPSPNPRTVAESRPSHISKSDVALRRKAVM